MLGLLQKEQEPPLVTPEHIGELITPKDLKATSAYIHGDAEELAGFDAPTFIDGNLGQLDLPVEEQGIWMLLPSGQHRCKAELIEVDFGGKFQRKQYHITLK